VLSNIPPQPPQDFTHDFVQDTLRLYWRTPSDIDLSRTRVNYRLDGIFPQDPNDGTNISDQPSLPDQQMNTFFVGMPLNIPHYFALFAIDSAGLHSIPRTLVATRISTSVDDKTEIPREFVLYQNYPNPFNPVTTLRYGLPRSTHVQLVIYDLLGREITRVVNQHQQVGYHQAVFNSQGLASGIYLYRLKAGDFTAVKKFLLIK
jgi:hypothetical protein